MNSPEINTSRPALVHALAIVGFITLVGGSMWLAVYSTRFVPSIVSRIGTAAVYLGSVFTPENEPTLSVIETPILPFTEATSTQPVTIATTTPGKVTVTPPVKQVIPKTAGPETSGSYLINGTTTPTSLSGLPDFIVVIKDVGYLATSSASSFVASTTVPAGGRPAVSFSIKNVGTNVSGAWRFSASIPTQSAYIFQSQLQQPLNPGDSIDYTLGFDQATRGTDKMISITANFDHLVAETNTENNSAATKITILGN